MDLALGQVIILKFCLETRPHVRLLKVCIVFIIAFHLFIQGLQVAKWVHEAWHAFVLPFNSVLSYRGIALAADHNRLGLFANMTFEHFHSLICIPTGAALERGLCTNLKNEYVRTIISVVLCRGLALLVATKRTDFHEHLGVHTLLDAWIAHVVFAIGRDPHVKLGFLTDLAH